MQLGQSAQFTGALVAVALLASCAAIESGTGRSGFEARYFDARSALEKGNYGTAIRNYRSMVDTSGPLSSRLRLELAHAYLRADQYDDATREAQVVAAAHVDSRRAAALAVVGTAQHRLAQDAMSRGDFGPTTLEHLRYAKAALDEMLAHEADLDPLGSMAQRRQMVNASLQNLGG